MKTKGGDAGKSSKREKRPEVLENSWVEAGGWKQKTELGRVVGGTRVCVATGSCGHISSPGILPTTICWAQRPRKFGCHTDSYTPRAMRMVIKIKGLREKQFVRI